MAFIGMMFSWLNWLRLYDVIFYYCGDKVNKKDMMYKFIQLTEKNNLLTQFLINVFGYIEIYNYNYIFRVIDKEEQIVIDIYDNVSLNKFNRYVYDFSLESVNIMDYKDGDVYVKKISVLNSCDTDINYLKFAYLFKISVENMESYALNFMNFELVKILGDIKNKSI